MTTRACRRPLPRRSQELCEVFAGSGDRGGRHHSLVESRQFTRRELCDRTFFPDPARRGTGKSNLGRWSPNPEAGRRKRWRRCCPTSSAVRRRCACGSGTGPHSGRPKGDTLEVRSPDAVRRLLWSPGELGLARAFVAGDLAFEGDIFEVLAVLHRGITVPPPRRPAVAVAGAAGGAPARSPRPTDPSPARGGGSAGTAALTNP